MPKSKKKKRSKSKSLFNPGDVIIFNTENEYFNRLSHQEKQRYYGTLFDQTSGLPKVFVYLCPINNPDGDGSGHHIMVDLVTSENHVMRHSLDFRKATWEEI